MSPRSPSTVYNQQSQWRRFERWCGKRHASALSDGPELVAAFLEHLAEDGYAMSTIRCYITTISGRYRELDEPDPCSRKLVRDTVRDIAQRKREKELRLIIPLTATQFAAVRTAHDGTSKSAVAIALIALMRDGLLRRSEAALACWSDLSRNPDGTGTLSVRHASFSKGPATKAYVGQQTMIDLRAINLAPAPGSRIFPLSPASINRRIAKACESAGLGPGYTSDSCRAGMAVDLADSGIDTQPLKAAGRWRSIAAPARYVPETTESLQAVGQYYAKKRPLGLATVGDLASNQAASQSF